MGFSDRQMRALARSVPARAIKTRVSAGKELIYIEGWYALTQANRIFGFDGWDRETVETKCLQQRETRGHCSAVYSARVRITVRADDAVIFATATAPARPTATGPAKFTTALSRRLRPMQPSGRLPPLVKLSASPFIPAPAARQDRMQGYPARYSRRSRRSARNRTPSHREQMRGGPAARPRGPKRTAARDPIASRRPKTWQDEVPRLRKRPPRRSWTRTKVRSN